MVVWVGGGFGLEVVLHSLLGVAEFFGYGTAVDKGAGVALMVGRAAVMVGIITAGLVDEGAVGWNGDISLVACLDE